MLRSSNSVKLLLSFLILLIAIHCLAKPAEQSIYSKALTDSLWNKKLSVITEYQYFRTVHHSRFDGAYAFLDYNVSANLAMGLGIAYTYSNLHIDNGYNLRHVKVLPVLADFRYVPFSSWKVCPFAVADIGYSTFLKYEQEDPTRVTATVNMTDHGLYTYGGVGILVKINHQFTLFTTAGFTGMHMSFNNLDVNPRGMSNQFGVKINLE